MRNDLVLSWESSEGIRESHFRLREFESSDGLVVVDSGLIRSLECVRRDLCAMFAVDVEIVITSGTRTEEDNARLAVRLGWIDEGGQVARDSSHLPKHGGIAVDMYARYKINGIYTIVPQFTLGALSRVHFKYVKDNYEDGHVHADNRREL